MKLRNKVTVTSTYDKDGKYVELDRKEQIQYRSGGCWRPLEKEFTETFIDPDKYDITPKKEKK